MGAGWDIATGELPHGLIGMKANGRKETCGEPDVMVLSMNGPSVANLEFGVVLIYTNRMQCHLGSPLGRQTSMSHLN